MIKVVVGPDGLGMINDDGKNSNIWFQKENTMDAKTLKSIVREQGEALINLADKIGYKSGEPFNEVEKQLIRNAVFPAVKESQQIIATQFIAGSGCDWLKEELKRLHELLYLPDELD
jgi:hypothetical protein